MQLHKATCVFSCRVQGEKVSVFDESRFSRANRRKAYAVLLGIGYQVLVIEDRYSVVDTGDTGAIQFARSVFGGRIM